MLSFTYNQRRPLGTTKSDDHHTAGITNPSLHSINRTHLLPPIIIFAQSETYKMHREHAQQNAQRARTESTHNRAIPTTRELSSHHVDNHQSHPHVEATMARNRSTFNAQEPNSSAAPSPRPSHFPHHAITQNPQHSTTISPFTLQSAYKDKP